MFVDSGAPLEPLLQAVEEWRVTPTHVLRTHSHPDHVEHESELGLPVVRHSLETGDLWVDAVPDAGALRRHGLLRDQRPRGLLRRHALQGRGRRRRLPADQGGRDGRLHADAARSPGAARAHRRDDDRPRVGAEPVRPRLARQRARRDRAGARRRPRRDARSSGRPTTTARARRGCASTTARTRSSAAHGWSAARWSIVDPRIEAYTERVSSPHDPLLAELSDGDGARARSGGDAHRAGRRTLPGAARLDRPAAARARDRHVQRALGARDGGRAARRRAHRRVRGRPRARRLRPGMVRPLAARLEDHAARRAGRRDDRVARRRVRLRLHRRRQGRLHRLLRGGACRGSPSAG